jgi:thiol-disulfide isomerase/thioredoxin
MKYKVKAFMVLFLILTLNVFGQSIKGTMTSLIGQTIQIEAFKGFKSYTAASSIIDKNGAFDLVFSSADYGMAYIVVKGQKPFLVLLSNESIELAGESFNNPQEVQILYGKQNQLFAQYAAEHPKREQALSAWIYLAQIYKSDTVFINKGQQFNQIQQEIARIEQEDELFLKSLPVQSYLRWFLPIRKTVSNVSTIAKQRVQEIPSILSFFRNLDYSDNRLYKSGLLKDAIEGNFWLIENSGQALDSVNAEMKRAIDAIVGSLLKDETKLNEVTDYLFDLLERQSLFQASEYLALKVLNEKSCTLNNDLAKQLETYRAMKKGNTAPDIVFPANTIYSTNSHPKKLSQLTNKYTVMVFGSSWCPKCKEELPTIAKLYNNWKANGVEVVFVSLDDKKEEFERFAKDFPFISVCDFKKWGSPIANDYYVFGTPTIYLLNQQREILLRPISVQQMDAWVDWFLVKGNK